MYWLNFLHIYQPIDQSKEILRRVYYESYKPLFEGFLEIPNIKINLNINGALTELLAKSGFEDVIENIKTLAETNRLEFTESGKYHPFLPLLGEKETVRQIMKNKTTNEKYFGKAYKPSCFFPPEMAYSKKVGKIVSDLGYPFIILDGLSYAKGEKEPPSDKLFTIKGTNKLIPIFRERKVSNCLMSALVRNKKDFIDLIKKDMEEDKYLCTAMDGETFGHHRPGLEKCLFSILRTKKIKQIFFSEITNFFEIDSKPIESFAATWASTPEDIKKGVQFYSWKNPKNKVHVLQWKFFNHLVSCSGNKELSKEVEKKIDISMASDQFFWASREPWWSIEMIEKGAWTMLQTLKSLPGISEKEVNKGENYYKEIIATAFWWQRSGEIEKKAERYREIVRIPFKERTIGEGKPEVYFAFINIMKKKMNEAAKKKNFERSILWRDAIEKIERKNDIYDAIHATDLLRMEVTDHELVSLMDKYKKKYNEIKPGQPEERNI